MIELGGSVTSTKYTGWMDNHLVQLSGFQLSHFLLIDKSIRNSQRSVEPIDGIAASESDGREGLRLTHKWIDRLRFITQI